MTDVAPNCPISHDGPNTRRGEPWSPIGTLQDLIATIPKATDLKSALRALHVMNNIIQRLNRGEPVVNNIRQDKQPDVKEKGENNNPNYQRADWILESRQYETQKLYNPDNEDQYIEIKVLKLVEFFNVNTSYSLKYYQAPGG